MIGADEAQACSNAKRAAYPLVGRALVMEARLLGVCVRRNAIAQRLPHLATPSCNASCTATLQRHPTVDVSCRVSTLLESAVFQRSLSTRDFNAATAAVRRACWWVLSPCRHRDVIYVPRRYALLRYGDVLVSRSALKELTARCGRARAR